MKKLPILKMERELRGWSQARVAEELDVTSRTIARWEQGLAFPYPYHRERLSSLFGKSIYELGLLADPENDEQESMVPLFTPAQPSESTPSFFDPLIPEYPSSVSGLPGRDELLVQIKQHLLEGDSPVLTTLTGLPGVGKTALTLALATDKQIQARYNDGILWAGLGPRPNVLSVLTHWGSLLGIRPTDVEDATSQIFWWRTLHATIGSRRMLIIIDDAWSSENALALRIGGSNCAHVMTTRLPLVAFAFSEQDTIVVPELEEADGLELLARFVPQLIEQDEEAAREIVRMVGGLPLAIKLMGHYLAFHAFSKQPRRLRTAIATLQDAQRRLKISMPLRWDERSSYIAESPSLSLYAVIAVSDQHLSSQAHNMLCALAVLPPKPNSFSEECALAISQEPVDALDELWDAGLLESKGPGRYMLHQTITDYASSQGQDEQAKRRLVRYMTQYLQSHEQDYEDIELDANNLQAGVEAAIELEMHQELFVGLIAFAPYLRARGRYVLADQYLQEALKITLQLEDQEKHATLLQYLADFAERRGEYDLVESYCQRGLELTQHLERRDIVAALLTTRGIARSHHGDYVQAQIYLEEGLQVARQFGDKKQICMLLCNLGRVADFQTNYLQAKEILLEGLTLARRQGYQELQMPLLGYLGEVTRYLGNYDESLEYSLAALSLARQLQYHQYLSLTLYILGTTQWSQGKFKESEASFLEGLAVARSIGHREQMCRILTNLGVISTYPFQNKYSQAEHYLREGLDLARQIRNNNVLPTLLAGLGATVGIQGDYQQANCYMQESIEVARSRKALWQVISSLTYWGVLHLKYQQIDAAAAAFQEVLSIDENSKQDPQIVAEARYGLATVAALRGNIEQAYRLGQESLAVFESIHHYMTGEVRQWLQGLSEKRQRFGADSPNARIIEE